MKWKRTQAQSPLEEKEVEASAEEDMGQSGEGVGTDQLLGYIVQFANAVELYQKKNHNCFRCGNLDHLVKDCTKDLGKTTRKVGLNLKEGMAKKGGQTHQKLIATIQATPNNTPRHEDVLESSLLEPQPTHALEWS